MSTSEAPNGIPVLDRLHERTEALEGLYGAYSAKLVRLARRRLRDREAAEDIAQETLVRALTHLEGFDASRPMWPWLKTIATRLIVDHVRRNSREVLQDAELGVAANETSSVDDGLVLQAVSCLPSRQRVAVALRYVEDWDPVDAAEFLGINRPAFEQLLFRARRRLRIEYARLTEAARALVLWPLRWARRRAARHASIRHNASQLVHVGGASADLAAQITAGMLALITALGAVEAKDLTKPPVAAQHAAARRGVPDNAKPAATHGSGRSGNPAADSSAVVASQEAREDETTTPQEIANDVANPNDGVRQPEDARITSVAFAPSSGGRTVYAAGVTECGVRCPPVLFASTNGGRTWSRLKADGFLGEKLILPPGHGRSDPRIFAMGSTGLQVSEDGGASFRPAATAGAGFAVGTAAISPAFDQGDPTILIGAQALMRYRADTEMFEPMHYALTGPLHPYFAPGYPNDPRIVVGGLRFDPQIGDFAPTVFVCDPSICSDTRLPASGDAPRVRLAQKFATVNLMYAFTDKAVFVSRDAAASFGRVSIPLTRGDLISDLALQGNGRRMFLAVRREPGKRGAGAAGLHVTKDEGRSWARVAGPLLRGGIATVTVVGDRVIAALEDKGIACSDDAGRTWSKRCRA